MQTTHIHSPIISLVLCGTLLTACNQDTTLELNSQKQQLGKQLFFDTNLSEPAGQACASCHQPEAGFADPDHEIPVSSGADPELFGNRNSPTAAYASFSPVFHFDDAEGIYFGGQFLDGRAATLRDQAMQPFLNPLEMANPDALSVVEKVRTASYASDFKAVYGDDIFNDTARAFDSIVDAIGAFEQSPEVNAFSSKYDQYLAGSVSLNEAELRGLDLFNRPDKGNCAACHPSTSEDPLVGPLLTDFSYDNLGVPANPDSPFLTLAPEYNPEGTGFVDLGLGGILGLNSENGKFKVPTLRNIELTGPYMHNGVFDTLEQVLDFYSDRDRDGITPEVPENVNHDELGALNLTTQEKSDIIAFLRTLTDGYTRE